MSNLTEATASILSVYYAGDEGKDQLLRLLKTAPAEELAQLILELMGLADKVTKSHEEMMRVLGLINGLHDREAEQLNLPTLKGALIGISLTQGIDQSKVCESCALRRGSLPNQCESTLDDLLHMSDGSEKFWCHENLGENGKCKSVCRGFIQYSKLHREENLSVHQPQTEPSK